MMLLIEFASFIVWALAVALFDWRHRLIPNALIIAGALCALAFAVAHVSPFGISIGASLAGLAIGFVALMPFYALGMMGAADVKTFAALGAWCGPRALVAIWVAASLAAGLHALVLLARRRAAFASPAEPRRDTTPYAALLALAALGHMALDAPGVRS